MHTGQKKLGPEFTTLAIVLSALALAYFTFGLWLWAGFTGVMMRPPGTWEGTVQFLSNGAWTCLGLYLLSGLSLACTAGRRRIALHLLAGLLTISAACFWRDTTLGRCQGGYTVAGRGPGWTYCTWWGYDKPPRYATYWASSKLTLDPSPKVPHVLTRQQESDTP